MTEAERRIVAFLRTSDATAPDQLPDWMLATLEGEDPEELSPELITAAALLYARRLRPGIGLDAARSLLAAYAADPVRLEELAGRITAFRLACCFERLRRAGRLEEVHIDDPFDLDGLVSVTSSEADWQSLPQAAPAPRDSAPGRHGLSRN
jgi:hypothetical protein